MIELWIADLLTDDLTFEVPTRAGTWVFGRHQNYNDMISKMESGQCATTFYAYNEFITPKSSDSDFSDAIDDLIRICLVLSFLTSKCVTPVRSTPQSEISFIQLGDKFIRARAIDGLPSIKLSCDLNTLFSSGSTSLFSSFSSRRMGLFLAHWISGLTCFTLEDMFLDVGVQMDIVKQCEMQVAGSSMHYFQGMQQASARYGIAQLGSDYKNMRNDIVHEGKLSGSNFSNKSKAECAQVIADTLNWIDEYIAKVCAINSHVVSFDRWVARDVEHGLPAFSFHV